MIAGTGSVASALPDEAGIIERIRQGDADAFGELVGRYRRRAFAVAWRIVRHREDAEDVVQESFIGALDKLDSFDSARPFGPWFFRIVANRAHNAIRSRKVRAAEPLPEALEGPGSPAADAEQAELATRVRAALADLTQRQRLVVELHELEGFSGVEIAAMLDVAPATVRWTLHEARRRLKALLETWKEERDHE